jgi:hypothetical protein
VPKASDSRDPGNPGINICIVNNVYYSGIRQYMHLYTVFISFEDFLKKKKSRRNMSELPIWPRWPTFWYLGHYKNTSVTTICIKNMFLLISTIIKRYNK